MISSAADNGGTWTGAVEALDAARITLYVKAHGNMKEGNRKLLARGGRPFPEGPWADLRSLFAPVAAEPTLFTPVPAPEPEAASAVPENSHPPVETETPASTAPETRPRDAFEVVLPDLLAALAEPRTTKEIEKALGIDGSQAKSFLKRACEEGHVLKSSRPVRYVATKNAHPLFGGAERDADDVRGIARS